EFPTPREVFENGTGEPLLNWLTTTSCAQHQIRAFSGQGHSVMAGLVIAVRFIAMRASRARVAVPSTSLSTHKDLDARHKAGHDAGEMEESVINKKPYGIMIAPPFTAIACPVM